MRYILITAILLQFGLCSDIFEKNCVNCHKDQPVELDKIFYRYLLKYSSERSVKKALYSYLKNPDYYSSVMPEGYINRFGIKLPSALSDEDLREAVDIYWERYKVFGRLK